MFKCTVKQNKYAHFQSSFVSVSKQSQSKMNLNYINSPNRLRFVRLSNVYRRPTRKILFSQINSVVSVANTTAANQLETHNIKPCSVRLVKLEENCTQSCKNLCRPIKADVLNVNKGNDESKDGRNDTVIQNREQSVTIKTTKIIFTDGNKHDSLKLNRSTYYDFFASNDQFSVDDFSDETCAKHRFLTRFHPDQYAGLTKTFSDFVYCTKITGKFIRFVCMKFLWRFMFCLVYSFSHSQNH